jgi:hypothetical protein
VKYELIKLDTESQEYKDGLRFRIKALKSFSDVKRGELGGFVTHANNLSQSGDCWVYNNAKMYDNSAIYDNSVMYDFSIMRDKAVMYDDSAMYNFSQMHNNSSMWGNSEMHDNSAMWDDSSMWGNSEMHDNSAMYGKTRIAKNCKLTKDTRLYSYKYSKYDASYYYTRDNTLMINMGYFQDIPFDIWVKNFRNASEFPKGSTKELDMLKAFNHIMVEVGLPLMKINNNGGLSIA